MLSRTALSLVLGLAACGAPDPASVDPVEVAPADDAPLADAPVDAARPPADTQAPGVGTPGNLWVEDATGQVAGVLFRRGSDDQMGGKAIYDLVTIYHPPSGLFYDATLSDAVVRYPATTYFAGYNCDVPIGVAAGGCADCVSGYGTGLRHGGRWYRVRGGASFAQMAPGSTRGPARATECVAHGTTNAKGFPVDEVVANAPPASFTAPLEVVWR